MTEKIYKVSTEFIYYADSREEVEKFWAEDIQVKEIKQQINNDLLWDIEETELKGKKK